jgi:hypothetical protein
MSTPPGEIPENGMFAADVRGVAIEGLGCVETLRHTAIVARSVERRT